jgi:hypothetical protein
VKYSLATLQLCVKYSLATPQLCVKYSLATLQLCAKYLLSTRGTLERELFRAFEPVDGRPRRCQFVAARTDKARSAAAFFPVVAAQRPPANFPHRPLNSSL